MCSFLHEQAILDDNVLKENFVGEVMEEVEEEMTRVRW
jgi:hypothetical protein